MSRRGTKRHAGETDFELNLASIIDCFTVLITYLLVSASFISLGVLDVSVPVLASVAPTAIAPTESMTVKVREDHSIRVMAGDKDEVLPPKEGQADFGAFAAAVAAASDRTPAMDTATVSAEPGVEYQELVKTIETIKPRLPNVAIGESD